MGRRLSLFVEKREELRRFVELKELWRVANRVPNKLRRKQESTAEGRKPLLQDRFHC